MKKHRQKSRQNKLLTPTDIAKKYVYGDHDALTDRQEVIDMAADIQKLLDEKDQIIKANSCLRENVEIIIKKLQSDIRATQRYLKNSDYFEKAKHGPNYKPDYTKIRLESIMNMRKEIVAVLRQVQKHSGLILNKKNVHGKKEN